MRNGNKPLLQVYVGAYYIQFQKNILESKAIFLFIIIFFAIMGREQKFDGFREQEMTTNNQTETTKVQHFKKNKLK